MIKSTKKLNETKNEVLAIEKERKKLIDQLFDGRELIEGSYSEFLGRCGHDNCHCKENPCHFVTKISWYENGKFKKNKIVRLEDREWVKKQANDYQSQKKALARLVKLNGNEKFALKMILKLKSKKYV